jgi:phenylacetate-CoA ligase
MSENFIVEVLDEDGGPCRPGEIGRVVVTDLVNFATPIIRYDTCDYAEVGPPCPCGRGLPTLARIVGRERNLVAMPDGTKHWPHLGVDHFWDYAPIRQFQFVQHDLTHIEARLVVETPLSKKQESDFGAALQKELGYAFDIAFTYFENELPRGPGGKLEEFVCLVAQKPATG